MACGWRANNRAMQSVVEDNADLDHAGTAQHDAAPVSPASSAGAPLADAGHDKGTDPTLQVLPEHIAARVVAWHNRHPLALRIGPEHVQGLGVVSMPFVARGRWQALFSEDFLLPLRAPQVARWAARHAVDEPPLPRGWPLRQVDLDPRLIRAEDAAATVQRYVISAAIEMGEQRQRLLLAPAPAAAILGRRLWSRARRIGALALTLALASACALLLVQPAAKADVKVETVESGAVSPRTHAASAPLPAPASSAPATQQAQPAAPDAQPRPGRIVLTALVPHLSDEERAALRQRGSDMRAAAIARAPAAAPARAFALVTRPLDRLQAQRAAVQLQAVAALQPQAMRVEQWPVGTRWQAVFWAFPSAQAAEKVRLALADKGLKVQVLEF